MAPRFRAPVVAVTVASSALVAALGWESAGRITGTRLDIDLAPAFTYRLSSHPHAAKALVHAAGPVPISALIALTVVIGLWSRRTDLAALAVATPAVALAITELALKPLVDKRLGGGLAFPSGRATACFAVAFVVAAVALNIVRPRSVALSVAVVAILVATVIAMCIVVSGDHYPTDVVAAAGVALGTVLGLALMIDSISAR